MSACARAGRIRIGKITPPGIELYREWHYGLESWRETSYLARQGDWCDRFPRVKSWNE